jgi:hypothetical protein
MVTSDAMGAIEISADQIAIFGPLVESIRCAVNTDKAFTRLNKVKERLLFIGIGNSPVV